jgi:hypothetical protein
MIQKGNRAILLLLPQNRLSYDDWQFQFGEEVLVVHMILTFRSAMVFFQINIASYFLL